MLFEVEEENRKFPTTQRKEYGPKKLSKLFRTKPFFYYIPEKNILTDAYKEHLNIQKKNELLPVRMRTVSAQDQLNAVRSKYPHLKNFLPRDPPDEAIVEREQKKHYSSVYQFDFPNTLDEEKEPEVKLPDNWPIPETTQTTFFRHPSYFGNVNKLKQGLSKNPDNLGVNEKEREILQTRTGNTEYQSVIGKIGGRIINEQFYGPPMPLEQPAEHHKDPDSARSYCSQILKNASKSRRPFLSQVF